MKTKRNREKTTPPYAGKIVLITGASAGLGAATAQEFARRGAQVILVARRMEPLEAQVQTICETGGQVVAFQADLADPSEVENLAAQVLALYGYIDILIHNVGSGAFVPLTVSEEQVAYMLHANLLGAMLLTKAFLPTMQARRTGSIISVAAVSGLVAIDPLYSATKFGLRGFTLSLRRLLEGSGISVSVISPGFIRPGLTHRQSIVASTPEYLAQRITRLVTHPRREIVVPGSYRLAVWAEHVLPWLLDRLSRRFRQRSSLLSEFAGQPGDTSRNTTGKQ